MNTNDLSKTLCDVYRSSKKDGLYLYVARAEGLTRVPQELLARLGATQVALSLVLTPERKLARVDSEKVLAAIAEQGFYLQLPPAAEGYMKEINLHNDKLAGGW